MQLVELQQAWPELREAGVALFAVSYDAVSTLEAFAARRGITFPLLSDEGSHTISALGLLNEHLAEQHAAYGITTRDEQRGVAYPGTFVLDEHGVITGKYFEQSYRTRPTASMFLEMALGAHDAPPPHSIQTTGSGIQVQAWTDAPTYRPYQQLRLHVRLEIPRGSHIYADPVPDGYVPLRLEVEQLESLHVEPSRLPAPHPFRVDGLDEAFVVFEGSLGTVIPCMFTSNLGSTVLSLRVSYQECTQSTCYPAAEVRLELPLEGLDLIRD